MIGLQLGLQADSEKLKPWFANYRYIVFWINVWPIIILILWQCVDLQVYRIQAISLCHSDLIILSYLETGAYTMKVGIAGPAGIVLPGYELHVLRESQSNNDDLNLPWEYGRCNNVSH